ncbi:MAG: hypothetical protein Kow0077_18140 [Anaerolineae bacterium]
MLALVVLAGCAQGPQFLGAGQRNADWSPVYADFNGLPMVKVPAGCFVLGRNDGPLEESPARQICLTEFWIGQFEVTNAQYARCVEEEACTPPADRTFFNDPNKVDAPVVNVTWDQAQAFAEWAGGSLPTEMQWEYAARGTQGYPYPWGFADPTCERAILDACAAEPQIVGPEVRRDGIAWVGAHDMAGNVWEWTASWYAARSYVDIEPEEVNPSGPQEGQLRVLRGGAYGEPVDRGLATYRSRHAPNAWSPQRGFRIMIVGQPPQP